MMARLAGHPVLFGAGTLFVLGWLIVGFVIDFSGNWASVLDVVANAVTLLMVFVLQNTQNRDTTAMQIKLDELIRASNGRNFVIGIEQLTETELDAIRVEYQKLRSERDRITDAMDGSTARPK